MPGTKGRVTVEVLASIRNFGAVIDGALARGEQPLHDEETWQALRRRGITAILSLRDDDVARSVTGRDSPAYSAAEERRLWEGRGFVFEHVPFTDHKAPTPDQVCGALTKLDEIVDDGHYAYLHCLAGVGRTGVTTAAWLMSRGWSGNDAAHMYLAFCDEIWGRDSKSGSDRDAYYDKVGNSEQWWELPLIAQALGTAITGPFPLFTPEPKQPLGAEGWAREFHEKLAPWRAKRPRRSGSARASDSQRS